MNDRPPLSLWKSPPELPRFSDPVLPGSLNLSRPYLDPDVRAALRINIDRLAADIGRAFAPAMAAVTRAVQSLMATAGHMREAVNAEPHVAGLCARYQVRAALDPAYRTPEALSELICGLIRRPRDEDPVLLLLTPENRIRVAVAALYGYATHRPNTDHAPLTFGGTVEHHLVRRHTFTSRAS